MATKATRLMREATCRWAIWRAEGTPGEMERACWLAHQALAWAVRQRQPVLACQARRLVEALEVDRLAMQVERDAIDRIRGELPEVSLVPEIANVLERIERVDEQLQGLSAEEEVSEKSRQLDRDDITWRAFE